MSETKHIQFEQTVIDAPPNHLKPVWRVVNKHSGDRLGVVVWYPKWRQFCFELFADSPAIFSADCLRDIASFCEQKTKEAKLDSVAETVRKGCAT